MHSISDILDMRYKIVKINQEILNLLVGSIKYRKHFKKQKNDLTLDLVSDLWNFNIADLYKAQTLANITILRSLYFTYPAFNYFNDLFDFIFDSLEKKIINNLENNILASSVNILANHIFNVIIFTSNFFWDNYKYSEQEIPTDIISRITNSIKSIISFVFLILLKKFLKLVDCDQYPKLNNYIIQAKIFIHSLLINQLNFYRYIIANPLEFNLSDADMNYYNIIYLAKIFSESFANINNIKIKPIENKFSRNNMIQILTKKSFFNIFALISLLNIKKLNFLKSIYSLFCLSDYCQHYKLEFVDIINLIVKKLIIFKDKYPFEIDDLINSCKEFMDPSIDTSNELNKKMQEILNLF